MSDTGSKHKLVNSNKNAQETSLFDGVNGTVAELLVFSLAINLLFLSMPTYLAHIYDLVFTNRDLTTLFYLSILILSCLALTGVFEAVRGWLAQSWATHYELTAAPKILRNVVEDDEEHGINHLRLMKDISTVRQALGGRSLIGLFDLSFTPLFVILLLFIHPTIGAIALFGVISLLGLAIAKIFYFHGRKTLFASDETEFDEMQTDQDVSDKTPQLMSLAKKKISRWLNEAIHIAERMKDEDRISSGYYGFLRFFRQTIQLFILGAGAYLATQGDLSAGLMFAASIIGGRALMPVEQLIGSWRPLASALAAHRRLNAFEAHAHDVEPRSPAKATLPKPQGNLSCENLSVYAPISSNKAPLISDISFKAGPGEIVAIIGAGGSGKTTLIESVAGLRKPDSGKIKFDGFGSDLWLSEQFRQHVGFAGQKEHFKHGSIAENIARFDKKCFSAATTEAATFAGVHSLIGGLENSYRQLIDADGNPLSKEQKRWISRARAFYGDPQFLLLDEPDIGMDQTAELMLRKAIARAKARNRTIVFTTQRAQLARIADHVLLLNQGRVVQEGMPQVVLKPTFGVEVGHAAVRNCATLTSS